MINDEIFDALEIMKVICKRNEEQVIDSIKEMLRDFDENMWEDMDDTDRQYWLAAYLN